MAAAGGGGLPPLRARLRAAQVAMAAEGEGSIGLSQASSASAIDELGAVVLKLDAAVEGLRHTLDRLVLMAAKGLARLSKIEVDVAALQAASQRRAETRRIDATERVRAQRVALRVFACLPPLPPLPPPTTPPRRACVPVCVPVRLRCEPCL